MEFDSKKYTLEKEEYIEELKSRGYILRHNGTGARIAILDNDDENKVFYIGFRTPPQEDTGVMHILEHSVLCGSEKYPVKDPFIELAKGSLNTFLNAMTFPDKTVYPVASCNDKDFANLMNVYLDAVFYPCITDTPYTFMQEGWHYEISPEDELTINGVVYNEMKGAFSSPDDVLERETFNSLFPDNEYGYESGGDPDFIPELTYEHYLEIYRKYYHPSNSYIYLYGKMDFAEKLEFLDREYLGRFEKISIDSSIKQHKPFDRPVEGRKEYSITDSEPVEDNTYLSLSWAMDNNLNPEEYIAFQVIDYALGSSQGALLKEVLLKAGIGRDIYTVYENGIRQPFFSVVAKKANETDKDSFVKVVREELQRIVDEGIDKDTLRAGLNALEFRYREADYGSYPPGLMYGLQIMDSWLYDDSLPFIHIAAGETYRRLREAIDGSYYEKLIERYMLNNNHSSILVVVPVKNLTAKKEEEQKRRLAEYKASLSAEEINKIREEAAALEEYQNREDSEEALAAIPMLTVADIKKETFDFHINPEKLGNVECIYHDIYTRGIDYVKLLFEVNNIPKRLLPYLRLVGMFWGKVDTEIHTYGELCNEVFMRTGGLSMGLDTYQDQKSDDIRVILEVRGKCFEGGLEDVFEIIDEIIHKSIFADDDRLRKILEEAESQMNSSLIHAGHRVASMRAVSYYSRKGAINDYLSGLSFVYDTIDLLRDFENRKEELKSGLKEVFDYIFTKENIFLDFTGSKEEYGRFKKLSEKFIDGLGSHQPGDNAFDLTPVKYNEGFTSASQVQFVCRSGNYKKAGLPYTGVLRLLKVILGYDYLWNNIRVKGGAYGCMSFFSRSGDSYLVSYRDPNLKNTVDVFEGGADYLEGFQADERTLTQYIIGTISELDIPLTPLSRATRELNAYLIHISRDDFQQERDEIIGADVEAIKKMADYLRAVMNEKAICVVGNEDRIKEEKELFDNVVSLIK